MATYHCSMKHGSKGGGASGKAKADYINREGKYADKPDLEYKESGNMPEWAQSDPRTFWKASDKSERANGRVWTEIEIALPREITQAERKELVQGFIKDQLKGHPYSVAIHNPKAAIDGGEQPHAHISFSERKLDGIRRDKEQFFKRAAAPYRDRKTKEMVTPHPSKGGAPKSKEWNDRDKVLSVREAWEKHYNRSIDIAKPELCVSCKSLKDQGLDRDPERHLGPRLVKTPAVVENVKELRAVPGQIDDLDKQIASVEREIYFAEMRERMEKESREAAKIQSVKPSPDVKPSVAKPQSEALPPVKETNLPPQQPASKPLAVDPSFELGAAGEPSFDVGAARSRLTQIDVQADLISRKYQPSAEEREAHKAAYMKPFTDRKLAYNQSVNDFNRDFRAWQEKGKEDGWTYKEPLKPDASWLDKKQRQVVEAMQSKEERAWQVQGNRLDRRRDEVVTEKENCERFKGQRTEDYRTRGTQELFIATQGKIKADPAYQKLQTEKDAINAAIREHKKAIEKTLDKDRGMGRSR